MEGRQAEVEQDYISPSQASVGDRQRTGRTTRRPVLITKDVHQNASSEPQEMVRCEGAYVLGPSVPVSSLGTRGEAHMAGLEKETKADLSVFLGVLKPQCA